MKERIRALFVKHRVLSLSMPFTLSAKCV